MAIIVCERVSHNIIAFLLVSVIGAKFICRMDGWMSFICHIHNYTEYNEE